MIYLGKGKKKQPNYDAIYKKKKRNTDKICRVSNWIPAPSPMFRARDSSACSEIKFMKKTREEKLGISNKKESNFVFFPSWRSIEKVACWFLWGVDGLERKKGEIEDLSFEHKFNQFNGYLTRFFDLSISQSISPVCTTNFSSLPPHTPHTRRLAFDTFDFEYFKRISIYEWFSGDRETRKDFKS